MVIFGSGPMKPGRRDKAGAADFEGAGGGGSLRSGEKNEASSM